MSRPRRGRGPGGLLLLILGGVLLIGGIVWILPHPAPPPVAVPAPTERPGEVPTPPPGPLLALVIDDVGNDAGLAERLLALPVPLTLAVLPHLPHSRDYGGIRSRGKEVLLHLPMEPEGYPSVDPGAGALLVSMDRPAILSTLAADLAEVPGAVGVNNHMGSRFTARVEGMRTLLGLLSDRGLFFLDSRTTAATLAGAVAAEVGVPFLSRNVFLDGDADSAMAPRRWREGLALAGSSGHCVMIGHLRPATVAFLEERVREGDFGGSTPVTVSTLLQRISGAGPRT